MFLALLHVSFVNSKRESFFFVLIMLSLQSSVNKEVMKGRLKQKKSSVHIEGQHVPDESIGGYLDGPTSYALKTTNKQNNNVNPLIILKNGKVGVDLQRLVKVWKKYKPIIIDSLEAIERERKKNTAAKISQDYVDVMLKFRNMIKAVRNYTILHDGLNDAIVVDNVVGIKISLAYMNIIHDTERNQDYVHFHTNIPNKGFNLLFSAWELLQWIEDKTSAFYKALTDWFMNAWLNSEWIYNHPNAWCFNPFIANLPTHVLMNMEKNTHGLEINIYFWRRLVKDACNVEYVKNAITRHFGNSNGKFDSNAFHKVLFSVINVFNLSDNISHIMSLLVNNVAVPLELNETAVGIMTRIMLNARNDSWFWYFAEHLATQGNLDVIKGVFRDHVQRTYYSKTERDFYDYQLGRVSSIEEQRKRKREGDDEKQRKRKHEDDDEEDDEQETPTTTTTTKSTKTDKNKYQRNAKCRMRTKYAYVEESSSEEEE